MGLQREVQWRHRSSVEKRQCCPDFARSRVLVSSLSVTSLVHGILNCWPKRSASHHVSFTSFPMNKFARLSAVFVSLSLGVACTGSALQAQQPAKASAKPAASAQKAPVAKPASASAPVPKQAVDKAAIEQYIRYLNLWNKDVTVTLDDPAPSTSLPGYLDLKVTASVPGASMVQDYYVSPDGSRVVRARVGDRLAKTVFETARYPFQAEQESLDLAGLPAEGPEGAPITLAVYSDFQCAFCREMAQTLRANLHREYPDAVRMVFVNFPLIQIHDWAKTASIGGRCMASVSSEQFWKYHDWVFENQKDITAANFSEKLQAWAQSQSVDGLRLQQCMQAPEQDAAVMASFQKAMGMGLNSTPTVFVNGRQLGGRLEWPTIKQILEMELDYLRNQPPAKTGKAAGGKEECCTVELPGLFPK